MGGRRWCFGEDGVWVLEEGRGFFLTGVNIAKLQDGIKMLSCYRFCGVEVSACKSDQPNRIPGVTHGYMLHSGL